MKGQGKDDNFNLSIIQRWQGVGGTPITPHYHKKRERQPSLSLSFMPLYACDYFKASTSSEPALNLATFLAGTFTFALVAGLVAT